MGLFDAFKKPVSGARVPAKGIPAKASLLSSNGNSLGDHHEGMIPAPASRVIEHRMLFVGLDPVWFEGVARELARLAPNWECQQAATTDFGLLALKTDSFQTLVLSGSSAGQFIHLPQTASAVRVVLCDGKDRAETARWNAAGAHPLPLTTDPASLIANVRRIAQVQEWVTGVGMRKLLLQCRKLPAMPQLYSQVTAELASPTGCIEAVARHIAQDPVMTAKLLQVVNSAFFALGREVTQPIEAVLFLGAERTRSLILLAGVFTQYENINCPGFSVEQIWNHSLQVGNFARTVAMAETRSATIAEAAFTAGLVHDMGKLILAANVPAMCQAIEQIHTLKLVTQREAELQVLGATHAELAAGLMGTWGLPLPVLEAVAWHHVPTRSSDKGFSLLTAVHAANVFAGEMGCGGGGNAMPVKFDHTYLDQVGLGDRRNDWRKACNLPARQEEDSEHAICRARRAAKIN
jgi:HD-like signal output (HDOD) protein